MGIAQIHGKSGGGNPLGLEKLYEGDFEIPECSGSGYEVDVTDGALSTEKLDTYDVLWIKVMGEINGTRVGTSDNDRWWFSLGVKMIYSTTGKTCDGYDIYGRTSAPSNEMRIAKYFERIGGEWRMGISFTPYTRLISNPLKASIYAQGGVKTSGNLHVTIYGMKL